MSEDPFFSDACPMNDVCDDGFSPRGESVTDSEGNSEDSMITEQQVGAVKL